MKDVLIKKSNWREIQQTALRMINSKSFCPAEHRLRCVTNEYELMVCHLGFRYSKKKYPIQAVNTFSVREIQNFVKELNEEYSANWRIDAKGYLKIKPLVLEILSLENEEENFQNYGALKEIVSHINFFIHFRNVVRILKNNIKPIE